MSTMPDGLRAAIDQMIEALKSQRYHEFLEQHVDPSSIIEHKAAGGLPRLIERLEGRAQSTIGTLESIRDRSPEVNEDGTKAVFAAPGARELVFNRIGERWYMMN